MTEMPTDVQHSKPDRFGIGMGALSLLAAACILFGAIGWFAPNFRTGSGELRHNPLGGDFLQEYTGGKLWLDPATRDDLYSLETFRATQHDAESLGFSWPSEKYFPVVYPPFWYALASPLSQLNYLTAARVWLALMVVSLIASLVLLKKYGTVPTAMLVVLCLSAPVLISLGSGQKGTLLLLILTASYCLFRANKPLASGVVFALIAFKPHLGLPIGLFMLASQQWRWVAGTIGGLLLLGVVSLLAGPSNCIDFVRVCLGFGDYVQSGGYRLEQGFSLWSGWQMLIADAQIAKGLTLASTAIVIIAAISYLKDRVSSVSQHDIPRVFAAMTLVTIVISPHLYVYDLTMLILPAGLLTRAALDQPACWQNWLPVGLIIGVMFGSYPLINFAALTGFQPGIVMLLAALVLVLRSSRHAIPFHSNSSSAHHAATIFNDARNQKKLPA